MKHFFDITLTTKTFEKQRTTIPAQTIQWNWDFRFFHTRPVWKDLKSPFHWIIGIGIVFNCRHIICMGCAFPGNWMPAFKLNTPNRFQIKSGSSMSEGLIKNPAIRETPNLLTNADSSTNILVSAGVKKRAHDIFFYPPPLSCIFLYCLNLH